jgi:hypothetical protein
MAAQETVAGTNGSILRENVVKVRIPERVDTSAGYVPGKVYDGQEGTWTLQNGDYLVRGLVDFDGPIKALQGAFPDVFCIVGFADNRRGGLPHWRVTGR